MRDPEKVNRPRPHLEIPEAATEPQAVISSGEEILDRAHKLAREIETHIQRALRAPSSRPADPRLPFSR